MSSIQSELLHHLLDSMRRDAAVLSSHNVLSPENYDILMAILSNPHSDVSQSFSESKPRAYSYTYETSPSHTSSAPPPVPPRSTALVPAVPHKPPRFSLMKRSSSSTDIEPRYSKSPSTVVAVRASNGTVSTISKKEEKKGGSDNAFAKRMGDNVANGASSGLGWGIGTGIARALF